MKNKPFFWVAAWLAKKSAFCLMLLAVLSVMSVAHFLIRGRVWGRSCINDVAPVITPRGIGGKTTPRLCRISCLGVPMMLPPSPSWYQPIVRCTNFLRVGREFPCLYVCMYVCVHLFVCMYVHMHTCMHAYICQFHHGTYVLACLCMYVCTHAYMHARIYMSVSSRYVCFSMSMYVCMHV